MLVSAGLSNHDLNFTFERKEGFPFWTYGFFHKGEAYIQSNGKEIIASPYDLIIIQPNTPYSTRIVPGYKFWNGDWIIGALRPEWECLIQWKESLPGVFSLNVAGSANQEIIKKTFRNAVEFIMNPQPLSSINATHALEEVLLLSVKISEKKFKLRDARILRAIAILSNNFNSILNIKNVSNQVGMSPSRLAHLFKEKIGETPMSFREGIRLQQAKQLIIGTNMSIKEIAETLAYDCPFHFSKRFKVRFGTSPKRFREQLCKPGVLK